MIEQRTKEWHLLRLGKATGSRFNDIMVGPKYAGWKNYKAQLVVERLTGTPTETYTSTEMQWGTDTEPLARLFYSLKTGNQVEETGFIAHEEMAAGISPDGLIGADGGVEYKCPNTATHIETLRGNKVPTKYLPQVIGGMWITGRKWWDFVSFDPRLTDNARMIIIRVERDEEYINRLEQTIRTFLKEVEQELEFIQNYGKEKL
jgi:predicted phage-related endonuclease